MIVTQARMVWLFSRLAREGYGDTEEYLDAAELGYDFLKKACGTPRTGDSTGK